MDFTERLVSNCLALATSVCQEIQWNLACGHEFLSDDGAGDQPILVAVGYGGEMQGVYAVKIKFHFIGGVNVITHLFDRTCYSRDPKRLPSKWVVVYATVSYVVGSEKIVEEWATEELDGLFKKRPWMNLPVAPAEDLDFLLGNGNGSLG